ncbi:nucleolar and coiled-body phosphoprotein 1-like [Hordeum vulgare]|nr:nucleolar and coiled-body phosphoprotein 1-like [Hordeum vulgare]
MKQPAASTGRAEKPQLSAPLGLTWLLLSKSRHGARSRRAPATSPMFVSRGWSRAAAAARADGEPSSPKVTCIGQVRMRKGKKGTGYCRCLKKAFLCGGLFDFDRTTCRRKGPPPEAEWACRPWVFGSRDVAVASWIRPLAA